MLPLLLEFTMSGPITPSGCRLNVWISPRTCGKHTFQSIDQNGHLSLRGGGPRYSKIATSQTRGNNNCWILLSSGTDVDPRSGFSGRLVGLDDSGQCQKLKKSRGGREAHRKARMSGKSPFWRIKANCLGADNFCSLFKSCKCLHMVSSSHADL
jgi:hypothetical protein